MMQKDVFTKQKQTHRLTDFKTHHMVTTGEPGVRGIKRIGINTNTHTLPYKITSKNGVAQGIYSIDGNTLWEKRMEIHTYI